MKKNGSKREEIGMLKCKVSPGMFPFERGITIDLPDGHKVIAFADKRDVFSDTEPDPGSEVEGRVRVSIVNALADAFWIDLPQPGITEGPRLKVPKEYVVMEAVPA